MFYGKYRTLGANQQLTSQAPACGRTAWKRLCITVRNTGRAWENDVIGTFRILEKVLLRGPKLEGLFISHLLWQPFTIQIPETSTPPEPSPGELAVFPSQPVSFLPGNPWSPTSSVGCGSAPGPEQGGVGGMTFLSQAPIGPFPSRGWGRCQA